MTGDFSPSAFAELRRRVATATDFNAFWDYYITEFVERPGFLQLGKPVLLRGAVPVLETTAGLMLGRDQAVSARQLVLIEVPGAGLVHGSGVFDGRLAAVLYVPEADVGVLAICAARGVMHYSRFWLQEESALSASA